MTEKPRPGPHSPLKLIRERLRRQRPLAPGQVRTPFPVPGQGLEVKPGEEFQA